jgi:hypothetical protein
MNIELQKKLQEIYERSGWHVRVYGDEFVNCIWKLAM